MTKSPTPEHYQRRVGGVLLDPYRIARVYGMADDALFSALKKILAAGRRGAKDKSRDVQDAIDALARWQEMEREDATPDPVTAALDAVDMADPMETTTVRTLARLCHEAGIEIKFSIDDADPAARIAELERERDEACAQATEPERERDSLAKISMSAGREADALRQTLDTERQAAVATAEELKRVRRELSDLQDRYRPRRQSEEPAPRGAVVMRWNDTRANWYPIAGINLNDLDTWTHQSPAPLDTWARQPPAPGEGE